MFKSIKVGLRVFVVLVVIITTVITQLMVSYTSTGKAEVYFKAPIVLTIGAVLLLSFILITLITSKITTPLKKIQKTMKGVSEGKIVNIKKINNGKNLTEIEQFLDSYEQMLQVVKKNNFDLNSQETKTEIILERMDDGVIAFSLQKQVIHMNNSAKQFLELDNTYDTFDKIVKRIGLRLNFDKIIYVPNYKNIEEKITYKDNVLNVVFVPFHSENLMPMGIIMIIKNITENEKLNNMRKEFVANVSHELKTPLCSIKGYSETILDRDLSYGEIQKFAKVINDEANRMDRIVADLLQLSRFDSKRTVMNKVKLNIDDLVKQVVENMQYVAKEKMHTLKCIVNMVPPPVYVDKDAISQVIINILSNSIKYTADGGEITVYIGTAGGKVYMKFVDNGMGIPEKDLRRIFERFYRVDKARSRQMGGTGLGLSIVKEIVEEHEGTIEIKSEVGIGTEVIVTLPAIK